ncbi:MAG TPA: rhomboid family intramembrane serine protease [Caldithrix abyssi]|uniref:Rhomboid family intramembrane serine protease n=1 Tax=Caldithrix abyssi TaxID=187145 RepID=A0A7V4U0I4_CALAY|nr:rhomboid family intramembrane serine protease [Caldithrix abyssi]
MYQNRSYGFGPGGAIPPAIKNLLFINGVVFLMQLLNPGLDFFIRQNFALVPAQVFSSFKIWQLVTYLFVHGGFMHILFNMFILWMFGTELEYEWGTREFLKFYFISGIGAGLFIALLSPYPTIGASGAIYGVMVAYALRYPDRMIYIYFLFPVKIKYFMIFLVGFQFLMFVGSTASTISHVAHLGGAVVGYVYLKYGHLSYKIKSQLSGLFTSTKSGSHMHYTKGGDKKTEYYRKVVDDLLDKINKVGYLNLTEEEKQMLEEGSRYLREHDDENLN